MPESFLSFVKSLASRDNVRTLSLSQLDQESSPYARVTANESLSFYSNVRNRSAGWGTFAEAANRRRRHKTRAW